MTSRNIATSGAKQNNTYTRIQFSLFKQIINTTTNVTTSITRSIAATLGLPLLRDNFDLWCQAYKLVQQRDGKLMEDYLNYLDSLLINTPLPNDRDLLSPEYVKLIVNQLFIRREKDGIHVQFPRADSMAQEEIENLAKLVLWSDSTVKMTVNTEPHTALAWSSISLFLLALKNSRVYDKAMVEGFNTLSEMQMFWKACEETYLTSSHSHVYKSLRDPLAELYSFLIEYQARAIYHLTGSSNFGSSKYVPNSEEWTEMIQPIKDLEKRCFKKITDGQEAEIFLNSRSQLQAIRKQVILQDEILQDTKKNKQDDIERKLLSDLASASGDYARYKNINPERVPGTCEWFLTDDRFRKWRDSQIGALLWASAGPGCGKSVLSRCLIDEGHLTSDPTIIIETSVIKASLKPTVICYFFFKEGGEGRMDGAHALCAILHQLFQHPLTSNLITYALSSHKSHAESLTQRMEVLWQILVDCADSSSADIICLLDALDECRGDSAQSLLHMIEKSYSQHNELLRVSKLKFLITSRPYGELKWSFDRLLSIATYMHFDGDEKSEQIGEEINLVIDSTVKQIAGAFSDNDRNKISNRLKSMKNRAYLWLHLTINIIEKKRSAYSRSADIEELLSELPSQVADAYEKILSSSQDKKKAKVLLQIILAATRPLTLDEANNALTLAVEDGEFSNHATLKENLWPQSTFKTTVQGLCGLFINIHDSKLSFIHQTAREFLVSDGRKRKWEGQLDLSNSHGILSRACINYLQMPGPSLDDSEEYPLFSYAAKNWFLHFRFQDADCTEILRKPARELCRTSSHNIHWILEFSFSTHEHIDHNSDLHLAAALGMAAVVYDVIVHEHADVNKKTLWGKTLLCEAIRHGHLEVIKVLLDPAHGARIDEDEIEAAAHSLNAVAMMTLLFDELDERGCEIPITEKVLEAAGRNKQCGAAVWALLLERCGGQVKITKRVVEIVACFGSAETMSLLLEKRGSEFKITGAVVESATRNTKEMLTLLLDRRGHEVKITEAVLLKAMESRYPGTLGLLLDHSNGIKITPQMVRVAAENEYGSHIIQLLLDKRGHGIQITEDIIKAAMRNHLQGFNIVTLLFDRRRVDCYVTEDIVKLAVINGSKAWELTSLLLDKRGYEFNLTKDIIKTAMTYEQQGLFFATKILRKHQDPEILSLLLDRCGIDFKITEDLMEAAIKNQDYAMELVPLLLDRCGDDFKITDDIIVAAILWDGGMEKLSLFLDRYGDGIITENVLKGVVRRCYSGNLRAVSLLLDRCRDNIRITDNILKAAVSNENFLHYLGSEVVALLLDKRGDEITITDDILKAAKWNWRVYEALERFQKKKVRYFNKYHGSSSTQKAN